MTNGYNNYNEKTDISKELSLKRKRKLISAPEQ